MSKFDSLYKLTDMVNDNVKVLREDMNDGLRDIGDKIEVLAGRVSKVEIVQSVCEKRQGRFNRMWCAIIGAIGVVIGGIFSLFTTKS